jgi:Ca-activated chloride channel family protein
MEEREVKGGFVAQYKDRFHYAMAAALAFLAFESFWAARRRLRPSTWLLLLLLAWPADAGAGAAAEVRRGNSAARKGDFAEALRRYEAAAAERPGDPVIRYDMGLALQELGRIPDARTAYLDALASPGADLRADAHYNLGNAFYRQGKLPDAIDAYRRALRERPGDRDARHNLEMALRGMQQASSPGKPGEKRQGQADQDSTRQGRSEGSEQERREGGREAGEERGRGSPGEQQQAGPDTLGQGAPRDTTAAGEPRSVRLTREQAEQLLRALERAEQEAQRERMKARAVEQRPGKDW